MLPSSSSRIAVGKSKAPEVEPHFEPHASNHGSDHEANLVGFESTDLEQNSPWLHGTFHLLTGNIGIGVLALPKMLQVLGWTAGVLWFVFISLLFLLGMYCIAYCCNSRIDGARLQTYVDVLRDSFGRGRTSKYLGVIICCLQLGVLVAFLLSISANALAIFNQYKSPGSESPRQLVFTSVAAAIQVVLCFFPNLERFVWVSIFGALATVGYVVIALYLCATIDTSDFNKVDDARPIASNGFESFAEIVNAGSFVVFAYGVVSLTPNVLYTLRANELKDPSEAPGRYTSMQAIRPFAIINIAVLAAVMIAGKIAFGPLLVADADVLVTISRFASTDTEKTLITIAQVFIIMHVIVGYSIFAFSLFEIINNAYTESKGVRPSWRKDKIIRISLIGISWFIACALPFFGDILGVVAAFFSIPVSYAIPPFMMYVRYKSGMGKCARVAFWTLQSFFAMLIIVSAISAFAMIINDVSTFKAFS